MRQAFEWDDGFKERAATRQIRGEELEKCSAAIRIGQVLQSLSEDPDSPVRHDPITALNKASRMNFFPRDFDTTLLNLSLHELIKLEQDEGENIRAQMDLADVGLMTLKTPKGGRILTGEFQSDGGIILSNPELIFGAGIVDRLLVYEFNGCRTPAHALNILGKLALLKPNQAEFDYHRVHPNLLTPPSPEYVWDNWGMPSTDSVALPKLARMIIAKELENYLEDRMRICFVGCGAGEEIRDVCATYGRRYPHLDITGFDSSPVLLEKARRRVPKNVDLRNISFNNALAEFDKESFDLVVAVGVIDRQTLSFEEGQATLETIRQLVTPDGHCLLASLGPMMFTNKQLEIRGFRVDKSWDPEYFFSKSHIPFHVLGKTDQEPQTIQDRFTRDIAAWKQVPNWEERCISHH